VVLWFICGKTLKGFEISVLGESRGQGGLPAFPTRRWSISPSSIAGGWQVLPASSEVSGAIGQLRPVISPGYGFTAIIVAFLGRLNPLGIVAAGLVWR
jgi:ABC-type uncharacterized transport system permease subunit